MSSFAVASDQSHSTGSQMNPEVEETPAEEDQDWDDDSDADWTIDSAGRSSLFGGSVCALVASDGQASLRRNISETNLSVSEEEVNQTFTYWKEDLVGTGLCGPVVDELLLANVCDHGWDTEQYIFEVLKIGCVFWAQELRRDVEAGRAVATNRWDGWVCLYCGWPRKRRGLLMRTTNPRRSVTVIASFCETRGWTDELALSPSGEPISKIWLATFVDAQVEIEDRKANLRILSWNSGGILTRMKDIQRLLVQTHPHLLLLQEARSINGNHNALVSECRAVGSSVGPSWVSCLPLRAAVNGQLMRSTPSSATGPPAPTGWTVTPCMRSVTKVWKSLLSYWILQISGTGPPVGQKHAPCSYPNLWSHT